MARNYKEIQERMDPASRADNKQRVRNELQRMALDELRNAKQLTQADMLPAISYVPAGVTEIMKKQGEGWAYLRP